MDTTVTTYSISHLLPLVRERREEIERGRQMPRDLVDQFRKAGIFRSTVPKTLGGDEIAPVEIMRTIETIATADGSAGWCTMIGTGNNVAAGYMPEEGAREVFADPSAPLAGIAAPAGSAVRSDGGVRVSGRWSFASGITHAEWAWAGCLIMEHGRPRVTPAGPDILHVCMPVSELQIHDTWYVSGLCGTGSHDFSATDVFVPERRTFRLLDPDGHRTEPLYQVPPLSLFVFQLVSVSLGIARGALDDLIELAQTKVPSLYTSVLAEKAVAQVELARAEAALSSARAFLYETVEEMWRTVCEGRQPTRQQIARGRIASNHVVETAASVTRTASTLAGGSSIYAKSPLQRHARDAEAVTHHFTVAPHVWEEAGRVLMGREPMVPVF